MSRAVFAVSREHASLPHPASHHAQKAAPPRYAPHDPYCQFIISQCTSASLLLLVCRLIAAPTSRRALLGAGLALSCVCCPPPVLADEYSYNTADPAVWSGVCGKGKAQSPVDLPTADTATPSLYGPIIPNYPRFTKGTCTNAGHGTPQVNLPEGAATCTIGDATLSLLQFHFHTPSEHSLDGRHAPMEVHLVHRDVATGQIVVLAALCNVVHGDRSNPCLAAALESVPQEVGSTAPLNRAINLLSLLPRPRNVANRSRPYVSYEGSLTTPPCSENVRWFVFLDPVTVAGSQLVQLQYFAGGGQTLGLNARQQKALGSREVTYSL
jgi:carbonic anhydrase